MQDTTKQTPEQVIPPRQENVISAGSTITSTMTYNPDTEKYEETVERTIIPVSGTERNVVERIYAEQELAATANYQQQTRFENITGIDVNQDDKIGDGRSYEEKVYRVEDTKTGERSWMRESEYMEKGSKGEVRGVPDLTTGGLYTAPGGYGTRLNLADEKPVASPTFTRFPDNFRGDLAAAQARLDSTVVGGGKKLGTTTIRSQDEASSAQDEFTTVGGTVVPTSMLGEQSVPVEAPLTLTPSGKRQRGFQVEYATLPQMIIGDPESGFKPGQFIEGFGASLGVGDLVYANNPEYKTGYVGTLFTEGVDAANQYAVENRDRTIGEVFGTVITAPIGAIKGLQVSGLSLKALGSTVGNLFSGGGATKVGSSVSGVAPKVTGTGAKVGSDASGVAPTLNVAGVPPVTKTTGTGATNLNYGFDVKGLTPKGSTIADAPRAQAKTIKGQKPQQWDQATTNVDEISTGSYTPPSGFARNIVPTGAFLGYVPPVKFIGKIPKGLETKVGTLPKSYLKQIGADTSKAWGGVKVPGGKIQGRRGGGRSDELADEWSEVPSGTREPSAPGSDFMGIGGPRVAVSGAGVGLRQFPRDTLYVSKTTLGDQSITMKGGKLNINYPARTQTDTAAQSQQLVPQVTKPPKAKPKLEILTNPAKLADDTAVIDTRMGTPSLNVTPNLNIGKMIGIGVGTTVGGLAISQIPKLFDSEKVGTDVIQGIDDSQGLGTDTAQTQTFDQGYFPSDPQMNPTMTAESFANPQLTGQRTGVPIPVPQIPTGMFPPGGEGATDYKQSTKKSAKLWKVYEVGDVPFGKIQSGLGYYEQTKKGEFFALKQGRRSKGFLDVW